MLYARLIEKSDKTTVLFIFRGIFGSGDEGKINAEYHWFKFLLLCLFFLLDSPIWPQPQPPSSLTSGPMPPFSILGPQPHFQSLLPQAPNPREVALVESHTKAQ